MTVLPAKKWTLTSSICCDESLLAAHGPYFGMVVFTQWRHRLTPIGRLARFTSTLAAPAHLTTNMLFLRRKSEAQDKAKVRSGWCITSGCACNWALACRALACRARCVYSVSCDGLCP